MSPERTKEKETSPHRQIRQRVHESVFQSANACVAIIIELDIKIHELFSHLSVFFLLRVVRDAQKGAASQETDFLGLLPLVSFKGM